MLSELKNIEIIVSGDDSIKTICDLKWQVEAITNILKNCIEHSYENKKRTMDKTLAMESAISETFSSVIGSSLTTIAGFLVLCLMELTLGKDLGIVMAKGVLLGLITVLTLFPALLLTFDKLLEKTSHKLVIKPLTKVNDFVKNPIVIHNKYNLDKERTYRANTNIYELYR